jgi:hypothetical protein
MDSTGMPKSRPQLEWFYRRSRTIMAADHALRSDWYDPKLDEYLAPNLVAEAAIDFGVGRDDDRVRIAVAEAGLLHGRPPSQLTEAVAIAVAAAPELEPKSLTERASSPEIEQRIRTAAAELHALQATQRPAYLLENKIGDRVVFSGVAKPEPLIAAVDQLLADARVQLEYDASHEPMPN